MVLASGQQCQQKPPYYSWYLWKSRNNYISQYHPLNSYHIKSKTISAILAMQLTPLNAGPVSSAGAHTDWWLPPPPGWLKLNFNEAFNQFTDRTRVGGVIRDLYGNLISAFSCEIRAQHPLEAELIALQTRVTSLPLSSAFKGPG